RWLKPAQRSSVPLLGGKTLCPQTHQREEFDSLDLSADGIPARQLFDYQFHFFMGQKSLFCAMQFAAQHLRIDAQSGSQFFLNSPRLAASSGNFLTEEIKIG
ncbi:MAG TPA: hypothetical protein VK134_00395, partial [Ktedonobacteraceae bacterium]|nr:hypothetical protein [Ktedonobacteraceae bacterium]